MNIFVGSIEVQMLLWSVVLGLVHLVIATVLSNKDRGLAYGISSRDKAPPPVGIVTGRLLRAFGNFKETFIFFAVAVLVVALMARQSPMSALGAARLCAGLCRRHHCATHHPMDRVLYRPGDGVAGGGGLTSPRVAFHDRFQPVDQARHMKLPVPGGARLGHDPGPHLFRQRWPRRDHGAAQPPHQAFVLGRIFESFLFDKRHGVRTPEIAARYAGGAGTHAHRGFTEEHQLNPA
jgi:uncharacterized MAPEG superfamily protein